MLHPRIHALDRCFGEEDRFLVLGDRAIRLRGLDGSTSRLLEVRWGGFLRRHCELPVACTVRVFRAGPEGWLDHWAPGEQYRIEALGPPDRRVVASYYFAVAAEPAGRGDWRLGITEGAVDEPPGRTYDNALRFLVACVALDQGGFAMHSAGVLRDRRAYLLLGPSGAGKTTATAMLAGTSLGDDFGIVVPRDGRWWTPALPFDNSERIVGVPPEGLIPVAGIWRLRHAARTTVHGQAGTLGTTVLMGAVAFPWAVPERAGELLDHARRFVATGLFAELHFSLDTDLWPHLLGEAGGRPRGFGDKVDPLDGIDS